ncbi:MAG: zinc-dependent alcohol dehydrogenase family protein [Ignavibacteriae bacterium]|nr:zinc-dependent alcohol dehydrogenase family protein [Ignavibacteriota bacterium]
MKSMRLHRLTSLESDSTPLLFEDVPVPTAKPRELLVKVSACGVCHTELDEIEGRTPPPALPIIPGHQVVGMVEALGEKATRFRVGDRIGVAWIFSACGTCKHCWAGNENLCAEFKATGRDADGGYAEYITVHEDFAFAVPPNFSDSEAAPLLCAGAIGYRSLRLTNIADAQLLGLTGFGASAHLVLKMVRHKFPRTRVFVFARNENERDFARKLGAVWAGATEDESPEKLDAIIDTTPTWLPVVEAMRNLAPGGRLVINAIRKEDADKESLSRLDYPTHLWMEKEIKSVANVSRRDVSEFLDLAAEMRIKPEVQEYALVDANRALQELKQRKIRGAKVLRV